jgi:hypothetical protein
MNINIHLIAYYAGIVIVFLTHIYTLVNNPTDMMKYHSYINIFAALLIAYYFMNKEEFISF